MSHNKFKTVLIIAIIILLGIIMLLIFSKQDKHVLTRYDNHSKMTHVFEYIVKNGDTIIHGKSTKYNKKGNKIAEGKFVNNEAVGKWIYYFDNGNVEVIHYRLGNKKIAESIYNYSDGKIRKYVLYDEFKKPVFVVRFGENGNVQSYDGLPLIEIYQFKIANKEKFKLDVDQHLKVGDTLRYKYLIANIPGTRRGFKIESAGVDNNAKITRKIRNRLPMIIDVEEVLNKRGTNTISAIVQYEFSDKGKVVIKDTVSFEVDVR